MPEGKGTTFLSAKIKEILTQNFISNKNIIQQYRGNLNRKFSRQRQLKNERILEHQEGRKTTK